MFTFGGDDGRLLLPLACRGASAPGRGGSGGPAPGGPGNTWDVTRAAEGKE